MGCWQNYKTYMIEKDNPFTQIFYVIIGPIAYLFYIYFIYLSKFHIIGPLYFFIGNVISAVAFYYYCKAWKTDPGTLNKELSESKTVQYRQFYDNHVFKKDNKCDTCLIVK